MKIPTSWQESESDCKAVRVGLRLPICVCVGGRMCAAANVCVLTWYLHARLEIIDGWITVSDALLSSGGMLFFAVHRGNGIPKWGRAVSNTATAAGRFCGRAQSTSDLLLLLVSILLGRAAKHGAPTSLLLSALLLCTALLVKRFKWYGNDI